MEEPAGKVTEGDGTNKYVLGEGIVCVWCVESNKGGNS